VQARDAMEKILESLGASDRFTVIKFGSATEPLWKTLASCTPANRNAALHFTEAIQASMGGTEIGKALELAYSVLAREEAGEILLITDGEVSAWQPIADQAKRSGHRIFTVGVGNAVSEAFVRELASGTGGECELVSPREAMAERIVRHFERMRSPRANEVRISWPANAIEHCPSSFRTVFDGDTVIGFARLADTAGPEPVVLEGRLETGETFREEITAASTPLVESDEGASIIARLAAHARLKECAAEKGLATALHYRLLSPWTNWIAIVERPDGQKAFDIPVIRKVPQTPPGMMLFDLCRSDAMPSAPQSPRPSRDPSILFQKAFSPLFSRTRVSDDSLTDALMRLSSRGMPAMIGFLSLVPKDEWRSLSEWAFQEGLSQLAKDATGFSCLLSSKRLEDMTDAQIRDGFKLFVQATELGFKLNPATIAALIRKRIISNTG
jgi:Ca-activated chloride channel family protein